MSTETNKALVERLDAILNTGDLGQLDELCSPHMVNHSLAPSRAPGLEGTRQWLATQAPRLMEATMMFLECPAYLDHERTVRCGLPAEVRCRFTMRSTGGPLESAMIRCPAGHYFSGPIESLTWDSTAKHDPGTAGASSRAGRDSLQGVDDGRDGGGGFALRDSPAEPEPRISCPNTAPAYYLGRPARLWITAIGSRPGRPHPTRCKVSPTAGNERHPGTGAPSLAPRPEQPARPLPPRGLR